MAQGPLRDLGQAGHRTRPPSGKGCLRCAGKDSGIPSSRTARCVSMAQSPRKLPREQRPGAATPGERVRPTDPSSSADRSSPRDVLRGGRDPAASDSAPQAGNGSTSGAFIPVALFDFHGNSVSEMHVVHFKFYILMIEEMLGFLVFSHTFVHSFVHAVNTVVEPARVRVQAAGRPNAHGACCPARLPAVCVCPCVLRP